jgi:hypothetical protein
MANQQHLTMYTAFGIVGVIEMLLHKKVKFLPKSEWFSFSES